MIEAAAKPCVACHAVRPIDLFPLAKPRADGQRGRYRFCEDCLTERHQRGVPKAEQRAVALVSARESRFRRRLQRGHW